MSSLAKVSAVVVVVLLGFSLVAPVAVAGPDGTSDATLGGSLEGSSGSQSSSSNTTDDGSTDGGSTDSSSADGGSGVDDASSSDSESTFGNGDSSSDSGSESALDDGDSSSDSEVEVPIGAARPVSALALQQVEELATTDAFAETSVGNLTTDATDATDATARATGALASNADVTLPAGVERLAEVETVTSASVGFPTTSAAASGSLEPGSGASAERTAEALTVSSGGAAPGGQSLPPAATGGIALGVGAVAAAALTRQGAVASLLPGVGTTLSTVATASLAPVVGSVDRSLGRLIRTVAPFRYSRYDDSDPLVHEARAEVFDVVEETPGVYLSEVSERADIPLSTARHHVRVLEREDLVTGAKLRGKRRFYPAHANGLELAAALNDEATAAVLDAIARLGAASVSDLADETDRDPSTVSHHLQRLEEDDLIVRERDGRAVMNKLSSEARTALEPETTPAPAEHEEPAGAGAGGAD